MIVDNLHCLFPNRKGCDEKMVSSFWLGPVQVVSDSGDTIPVACLDPGGKGVEWWCPSGGTLVSMLQNKQTRRRIYKTFSGKEYDDMTALVLFQWWGGCRAVRQAGNHMWRMESQFCRYKGLKLSVPEEEFLFYAAAFLAPEKESVMKQFPPEQARKLRENCAYLKETA